MAPPAWQPSTPRLFHHPCRPRLLRVVARRHVGRFCQPGRVPDRLHVGTVSVNTVDALSAMTPFGGVKQSGFGRDLSLHSFDKYSSLKTVWIKY